MLDRKFEFNIQKLFAYLKTIILIYGFVSLPLFDIKDQHEAMRTKPKIIIFCKKFSLLQNMDVF